MPIDAPLRLGDIEFLNTWPVTYVPLPGARGISG
jgi:hypothetical protein